MGWAPEEIFIKSRLSPQNSSIKREIFQSSILLALIVGVIFGCLLTAFLYYSEISKARAVISRTNQGVALFIDGYFAEIVNTVKVLDGKEEIREAMTLGPKARQSILADYRAIRQANRHIAYIYSAYENGLLLINDYTPPAGYDPTTRPWYRAALATRPETSICLPYQEAKTKEWLVSTSRALQQADGGYGGVVAVDCSIDQVMKLIAQPGDYGSEFSFVLDRSGKVIMPPDQSLLGKAPPERPEFLPPHGKGDLTYRVGQVSYLAHASLSPATGWTVVTAVEKREILRPIIWQVLLMLGLIGVIAGAVGFVQSILLGRLLSRPLVELSRKIKATIAGEELAGEEYIYPNNEFGIMAREIGQLAEKALSAKALELQASEEIYKTILMASPDDITIADLSGRIIMVSMAATKIFGYALEEAPGMSVMDFIVPEDHERAQANIVRMIRENYHGPNEYRAIRKDRSRFDIEVNNALIRDQQGKPVRMVLIVRDITSRKKAERQIQELVQQLKIERDLYHSNSLTDSLTGLANRRYFDNALRAEFARHQRLGSQLSLIMMDVDYFKKYNDHYGHLAGDECLRELARTLKSVGARAQDIVARYGGEEFAVILPDTDDQGALVLAERIRESVLMLGLPHTESDISEFVTISLGIASVADRHLTDGAQLVALADQAMYKAKNSGRNRSEVG